MSKLIFFAAGCLVGAFSLMVAPALFDAFVARVKAGAAWLKRRF